MEELLEELAKKTQENQADEAEAVKGYTEQAALIRRLSEIPEYAEAARRWEATNDEIIADELNHQLLLNRLYAEITGIQPNND